MEDGKGSAGLPLPPEPLILLSPKAILKILTSSIKPLKAPSEDLPINNP